MGLSIHYSGKIRSCDHIPQLTEEVKDICKSLQWKYTLFNDDQLQGIVFSPENCEPCMFTFNTDGVLMNLIAMQYHIEPVTLVSVKTQYAGIDAHIAVIKLIRYLSEKYFSQFQLQDEGEYWEKNDESILKETFSRYQQALNTISEMLNSMEAKPFETAESLAARLEALLRKKWNQ